MKYLPSILAALLMLSGIFAQPIQAAVSHHPTISLVVTSLLTILAHFSPSPTAPAAK